MEGVLGTIMAVGFNFAPRSWAFCDGQLLPISSNTALFSLLGTQFGGDGRTTFGLPDLRGRTIVGAGSGPGLSHVSVGQKGGTQVIDYTPVCNYSFTLTEAQMPSHSHTATLHGETASATHANPQGRLLALPSTPVYAAPVPAENKVMAPESITVENTGGSQAVTGAATGNRLQFDNRGPYQGLHYVICLQGIYPSRS